MELAPPPDAGPVADASLARHQGIGAPTENPSADEIKATLHEPQRDGTFMRYDEAWFSREGMHHADEFRRRTLERRIDDQHDIASDQGCGFPQNLVELTRRIECDQPCGNSGALAPGDGERHGAVHTSAVSEKKLREMQRREERGKGFQFLHQAWQVVLVVAAGDEHSHKHGRSPRKAVRLASRAMPFVAPPSQMPKQDHVEQPRSCICSHAAVLALAARKVLS